MKLAEPAGNEMQDTAARHKGLVCLVCLVLGVERIPLVTVNYHVTDMPRRKVVVLSNVISWFPRTIHSF